ncbi:MAG: hypothetical protein ABH826_04870 [Patescibacteria group bacterium]
MVIVKDMYVINRGVAIIKPKQPFVDWANQLPDAQWEVLVKDFQDDCLAVLIPEYDNDEEAKRHINKMYVDIFNDELFGWCTNEKRWPKNRTRKMFWEWFDVEFHSVVIDPTEEPILKEDM